MKKVIAAILGFAAIALPQSAIGIGIVYRFGEIYQASHNGKKYLILLGQPNAQITMSWQPPTVIPDKIPKRKARTFTLNECGFKNVAMSATFPAQFTTSDGPVALPEEYGYTTEYIAEAPAIPVCRAVGSDKIPYVIEGWQP